MPIKRLGTVVIALTLAVSGIACSNSVSETNGPTTGLDRATPPVEFVEDPGALACEVAPVNVFADGGDIPFELSCETMSNAIVRSLRRTYENGCLVGLRGIVEFSDSGNRYGFSSEVNGCWQDGGTLRVCKFGTTKCMDAEFPLLTRIEENRIPESK